MNIELLKTYYNIAPLSMQCNQSDGARFPVSDNLMPSNLITVFYGT